jgi:glycosyltransferase involved in cell wall biosynthesis
MKEKLSIVHINTHDVAGGAAKVAWRLVESQRETGHNSNMLVSNKKSSSGYSFEFSEKPDMSIQNQCRSKGQIDYEFYGSYDLIKNPLVQSADVLHLHNLHGRYFNLFSLSVLSHAKPIVWTLHDMYPITGHCVHSFNCDKWQNGCGDCPFLRVTYALPVDTSAQLLEDKKLIYDHSYLQIVTPSHWLKSKVEKSILGNHPVELIYNGINTNTFRPYDKKESRKIFGIPTDAFVIGSVANGGALQNQWKGSHYSQAVLDILRDKLNCVFVNIGSSCESKDRQIINIPHISDENKLAQAYSVLDVFLYTPIADNCPLVVIESLACGVPIVTFGVGGVPELVRDGRDGYILNYRDVMGLVQSLEKLAKNRNLCDEFGSNARQWAISKFEHKLIADQYLNLYQRCLQEAGNKPKEAKLFALEKVPKAAVSDAFLRAEDAKKSLQNSNRTVEQQHELFKNDSVVTSGISSRVGAGPKRISPSERFKRAQKGECSSVGTESRNNAAVTGKPHNQCDVSILLCTKNRAKLLDQMLVSLKGAVGGISYEMIVVEGGSSDNTIDILHKHGVTEIYNESECMGPGRHSWPQLYNFVFSKARGKWGMFASDDIVFSKGCITNAVRYLEPRGPEVAGGIFFFKNVYESSRIKEFERSKFFVGMGYEYRILMNYGLVRLDYFREVSGFGEEYQFYYADSDLCCKLYDTGRWLIPLPECFIIHDNEPDALKQANGLNGEPDCQLYSQRWGHLANAEESRAERLVWHKDLADAFSLPADLPKVGLGFEYFWQGIAYFQREMFEDAMEKFSQAMGNGCSHWKVLWYSAQAAYGCGQIKFAEKAARIVIKLAPEFTKAQEFLTRLSKSEFSLLVPQEFERPTSEKSVSYLSSSKQVSQIGGLIFSKDRAMQLQAAMESFLLHCKDSSSIELCVLYKTSNNLHEQQYDGLKEKFPNVSFIKETDFKKQVLAVIPRFEHILFLVDDNLFVKDFCFADVIENLRANEEAIGFSLRLGKNTRYCYTRYVEQNLPVFQQLNNGILKFDWTKAKHDFGYPLEVSSSVYRTKDIQELITRINFHSPNTLEGLMATNAHCYRNARSKLLCYECSIAFCNPINMVQTVWDNRVCSDKKFSADDLAEMFKKGIEIDIERYCDFVSNSCHQEVSLYFKENRLEPVVEISSCSNEKALPLISVTMVTYNGERFIRQAIDSVLAQTYKNFELLIVDDGSTDGTRNIVTSYTDSRIRYIYTPHKNYAAGKNRATAESRGEYLLCVDSDDFIAEDYVEKIVHLAEQYPEVDYFYPAKLTLVDESGDCTGADWEYLDFSDNKVLVHFLFSEGYSPIPNPAGLKRKLLFDRVGGYEELETVEDFVFLCKNVLKIRFKWIDAHSKYFYRRLPNSLSHKFEARDQITARVLNEMVEIYQPEEICPMVAGIADADLKKRRYYEYLAETFYKHARGYHIVHYGEYFKQYGDYYKEKLLNLDEPKKIMNFVK